jgi:hypothetical protein
MHQTAKALTYTFLACFFFLVSCGQVEKASSDKENWTYDVDMEQFIASMRATEDTGIVRDLERETLQKLAQDRETFMSGLVKQFKNEGTDGEIAKAVKASGYASLEEWAQAGNGVYQAIAVISFSKVDPDAYAAIKNASPDELEAYLQDKEYRQLATLVRRVPDELIEAVRPHYDYMVIDRPDTAASQLSTRIEDYERFIATMMMLENEAVLPELTADEQQAFKQTVDPLAPMSSMVEYYEQNYPGSSMMLAASLEPYGFYPLNHWTETGDRVARGLVLAIVKRDTPEAYSHLVDVAVNDAALSEMDEIPSEYIDLVREFDSEELAYFEENLDRFTEAFNSF